jgi:hypothetical protein
MNEPLSRRQLLERLALGVALAGALPTARPDAPLLAVDAPEAKALKYVENATQAKGATPGASCANCGLYQGKDGSASGLCQLIPGKLVKAAGWCTGWVPQM